MRAADASRSGGREPHGPLSHGPLSHGPVEGAEAARLFAPLELIAPPEARACIGLAVSGGADSMALMHLVAAWAATASRSVGLYVLSVDHGLRPTSVAECEAVEAAARALGLPARTLVWQGGKPTTGIAARARAARYRLLAEAAATLGLDAVVTAHTLDDQAETLLMRLARGSGLDGLAGIPARAVIGGLTVLRPLLGMPHERLVATLEARGATWIEDPSNHDPRFERARLRAERSALERLGLTAPALAASARRLARARASLETQVEAAWAPASGIVRALPVGAVEIDWTAAMGLPEEVRIRLLLRSIEAVAAPPEAVSLARLEAMTEGRGWMMPAGRTLAGAVFMAVPGQADRLLVGREIGRRRPLALSLEPGRSTLWDRRFRVTSPPGAPVARVDVLGADGLARLEAQGWPRPRLPARLLTAVPAFTGADGTILAVPSLAYTGSGGAGFIVQFIGMQEGDAT